MVLSVEPGRGQGCSPKSNRMSVAAALDSAPGRAGVAAQGAGERKRPSAQRAKPEQRKRKERSPRTAAKQRKTQKTKRKRVGREEFRQVPAPSTREQMRSHARKALQALKQVYGEARCGLRHDSAFQLLIAAILAADNSDRRVNRVTRLFFSRYPDAQSVADASTAELKPSLPSIRCPLRNVRAIRRACEVLVADHEGEVPDTMSAMRSLGIEPRTASLVLRWFGKTERVVTDSHGLRVALRLGLAPRIGNPVRKEHRLTELVPRGHGADFGYGLTRHGREVCHPQSPKCGKCVLRNICPRVGLNGQAGEESRAPTHHGPSNSSQWTKYKRWFPYRT